MTKAPTSMGLSQREVPKRSTDAKGIILKISFVIAADMHQNIIAFHATNGMLNKDTETLVD